MTQYLEKLPIVVAEQPIADHIVNAVRHRDEDRLNELVYRIYGLSSKEVEIIREYIARWR
jgi:hypothetical protein